MGNRLIYSALAAIPMLITPSLFYILAEGWFDFGGGEKDILLAFPYFIWALIFFVSSLTFIIKGKPLGEWLLRSGIISIVALLLLGILVYINSWLGII